MSLVEISHFNQWFYSVDTKPNNRIKINFGSTRLISSRVRRTILSQKKSCERRNCNKHCSGNFKSRMNHFCEWCRALFYSGIIWKFEKKRKKETWQVDVFKRRLFLTETFNVQRAKSHPSLTKSRWTLLPFHGGDGLDDSSQDCAWRVQTIRWQSRGATRFFLYFSHNTTSTNERNFLIAGNLKTVRIVREIATQRCNWRSVEFCTQTTYPVITFIRNINSPNPVTQLNETEVKLQGNCDEIATKLQIPARIFRRSVFAADENCTCIL